VKRSIGAEHLLGTLHQAIVPPARPSWPLLAWRWRYELALLAGLFLTLVALVGALGVNGAMLLGAAVVTTVLIVLAAWPAARHWLTARTWCILTPHRLRAGCAQARIHTRRGRLPAILWCAPKPFGEQVLIWCPAGVSANDFLAARQVLATACYASKIKVATHSRYRHIVILDVIRYQSFDLRSPDDGAAWLGVHLKADSDADLMQPTSTAPPMVGEHGVNPPIPLPRPNGASEAESKDVVYELARRDL
jgi:hypothetical protein